MRRPSTLLALAATAALTTAALTAGTGGAVGAPAHHRAVAKGAPGSWTKISRSTVGIIDHASMTRTSDGVLHVVYPRDLSGGGTKISHTSLNTNGTIVRQNDVLAAGWATMDTSPIVVNGASGMHTVFGGQLDILSGFFDSGRMFMADATSSTGAAWTLPSQNVGISNQAYASYGTSAVELADGTVVAAFPLNGTLTWHVGTGSDPDGSYTVPVGSGADLYDTAMVRDRSNVWVAWYSNGSTSATNGVFAKRIYPSPGPVLKAPGSSRMSLGSPVSIQTGRIALAARAGGGVYAAYCLGYPSCTHVRLWKVATTTTKDVKAPFAAHMALSSGPAGRLWLTWSDNIPRVKALRTGKNGLALGAVRTLGVPKGHPAVYNVAIEGSRGRGDIVVNVGDGFWHTQVLAGLTLHASPAKWRHGSRQRVVFTVTDAHSAVRAATVKVGTRHCSTGTRGTCAITFPGSFGTGRHTATASKSGYAKATLTLRVT
jgi:hypothetical protein